VLPFTAIGNDPDDDFHRELWAAVHSRLADVQELRVPAMRASRRFSSMTAPTEDIGRALSVSRIVDGTVSRVGDDTIVRVELLEAASGIVESAASYELPIDYDLDDVYAIQDRIARDLLAGLGIVLDSRESARLAERLTDSPEAYEAYWAGQLAFPLRTQESLEEALQQFNTAVRHDPGFAEAHVGLANAYLLLGVYGGLQEEIALSQAALSIEEALTLDPDLSDAFTAKGLLLARQNRGDRDAWEEAFEKAIELNPEDALAYHHYGSLLLFFGGGPAEARTLVTRAGELNPTGAEEQENVGWLYLFEGEFEKAVEQMRLATILDPEYPLGHMGLGVVLLHSGRADLAIGPLEKALAMNPADSARHSLNLGNAYAALGRDEEALAQLLGRLDPESPGRYLIVGDAYRDGPGSLDEAVDFYQSYLERRQRAPGLMRMALLELDRGDDGAAERWIAEAEEIEPRSPWTPIGRLNLDMYRSRFAEGASSARDLAENEFIRRTPGRDNAGLYSNQHPIEPLGYFGVLAGRPQDSRLFFETNFPELFEDDPPVNAFTLKAAIDLAAVLMRTDEAGQANLLLEKSEVYIDGLPELQRRHQFRTAPMHIYALQGRTEDALDAMQLAIDDGFASGWWRLDKKPHFESVREEPRFQEMMRQLREKATG